MANAFRSTISLFEEQLIRGSPRTEFAALVKKHGAERGTKGFTCWTQFVSMLFCQLAQADSLRELFAELKGKTIIVVSHDDRYFADRVFKMDYGKVVELQPDG